MKESTKNKQLEKLFFEILKFFWEPRIYTKTGFLFFSHLLGKRVYTQADNRRISIADSNNFVAIAPTTA
jgi:hypothetical protein